MKINLFIGEGWTPFSYEDDEDVTWRPPTGDNVDLDASVLKLAALCEARIRDLYSDAEVVVMPQSASGGALVRVDASDATIEEVDYVLPLKEEDLEQAGFDPAEMIEGEVASQIDGIITAKSNDWIVEI